MNFETGSASLHAGLIQRARSRRHAPPAEPVIRAVPPGPIAAPEPAPRRPERRFGLTVRVGWRLRTILLRIRSRTGRTTQSILHDALVHYLSIVEREAPPR